MALRPVLPLALPLRDSAGAVIGVVAAALDLSWLSGQLRERSLAKGGSVTVADRNGVILARDPLPEQFVGTRIPDQFQPLVHASEPGSIELTSQDGTRRVLGYVPPTPKRNFYVSAGLASDELFAAINRATFRGLSLIGIGFLLALAAAWIVGDRFFRRPIARLLATADRWRSGDYATRTGLASRPGEFGALGQAFDGMVAEVARRQSERDQLNAALQSSEERLRAFNADLEERVARMLAERQEKEEVLRHAQKMQAVGLLAGGVAHDFNNLLTAISGHLRHLRQGAPATLRAAVDGIELAVRRGERVARQLLAFTRAEPARGEVVELRAAVAAMLPLLERSLHGSYAVVLETAPEPCPALVDIADLELALLNLLTNARDATPDGSRIRITVGRARHDAQGGDRVVLGVHDSGSGMAPEVQNRAFEPFFTTKAIGRGTGLGLSSVYGFARQSGGTAEIQSRPGQGTSVLILLPLSAQPMNPAPEGSEDGSHGALPPGGSAGRPAGTRVLVVEDDLLVRMVTVDAIEEAGYRVTAADDGVEALAVLEREGADLAAVVTDIAMPGGVSGIDVARAVKRNWPHLALVLTTGYTADAISAAEMPALFTFVPKPFAPDHLVDRLGTLLDRAAIARAGDRSNFGLSFLHVGRSRQSGPCSEPIHATVASLEFCPCPDRDGGRTRAGRGSRGGTRRPRWVRLRQPRCPYLPDTAADPDRPGAGCPDPALDHAEPRPQHGQPRHGGCGRPLPAPGSSPGVAASWAACWAPACSACCWATACSAAWAGWARSWACCCR